MKTTPWSIVFFACSLCALFAVGGCKDKPIVSSVKPRIHLRIATVSQYPGMAFIGKDGQLTGFEVDIMKAVCKTMRMECDFVVRPWMQLIPSLLQEKEDAVFSHIYKLPYKGVGLLATNPYWRDSASFLTLTTSLSALIPDDLKGKKIGVQSRNTYLIAYLKKHYPHSSIALYNNVPAMLPDLKKGYIAAIFARSGILKTLALSNLVQGRPMFTSTDNIDIEKTPSAGASIVMRRDDFELKIRFNAALETILANGTYAKIAKHWFGIKLKPKTIFNAAALTRTQKLKPQKPALVSYDSHATGTVNPPH